MTTRILILALILFSCVQRETEPQTDFNDPEARELKLADSLKYVVLKLDDIPLHLFINMTPDTLTQADLDRIEQLLFIAVVDYNCDAYNYAKHNGDSLVDSDEFIDLSQYHRQYVPVIDKLGEKHVWVNCFLRDFDSNSLHEIVIGRDGGNSYFNVKINLTKGISYDFMINGRA